MTGAHLPNPDGRILRFELAARGAIEFLRHHLAEHLQHVRFSFVTLPSGEADQLTSPYYSVDRPGRLILLYRMPIQRARVLHVEDAEHRRMFIEHCVYRAVCDYLGRDPWELMPGRFDHY